MATDKITEIVDQSAFDQVTKLKAEMKDLSLVFADLLKQAKPLSDSLGGLGKGGGGGISGTTKALDEMDKMLKQLATTRDKLAVADTQVKLALEQEKIALQNVNKEIKENIKFEKAQEGSVDQIRAKLGLLQRQYDALGKSARDAMGKDMLTNIQKLDTELKKIEGSTGRYQRNVGNYTNATFQLSQVIRELPAFTYSTSTGIMALSNNLPMLADGFRQVSQATNETTGKVNGTMGALKIFGASIFSFGNIFSIAVALFTLFNKQIIEAVKGTKEVDQKTKDYTKSLGDAEGKIRTSIEILNNKNLSHKEHLRVAEELKKTYPVTLANYSAEEIAAGKAAKSIEALRVSIVNLAKAKAIQADLDAQSARQYEIEKLRADGLQKIIQLQKRQADQELVVSRQIKGSDREQAQISILNNINNSLRDEKDNIIALTTEYSKINTVISGMAAKISGLTVGAVDENPDKPKKIKDPKEVDRIKELEQAYDNEIKLTKKKYSELYKTEEEWQIKLLEINYDYANKKLVSITNLSEEETNTRIDFDDKILKSTVDTVEKQAKAQNAQTKKDIDNAKRALKANIEANEQRLKDEEQTCKDIDIAGEKLFKEQQERAKKLLEEQKRLQDAKKELLEDELNFAYTIGTLILDASARRIKEDHDKRIEYLDREEKRQLESIDRLTLSQKDKEEQRRLVIIKTEAEKDKAHKKEVERLRKTAIYQKALDSASIIASTAIAVTAALGAKPYTPANLALAAAAGVAGATQLARAIAAPIPQYADGTNYHPTDQPFLAGEAGAEGVILPSGKKMLVDRPTIFPAGLKGTKVISNKELMQNVYNTALVKLASQGTVTTNKMQEALIQSLEEQAGKIDNVVKAVENLKLSVKFENFSDHISHVKQRTR